MKLSAPKTITFIVGVALGVLALVFEYVPALGAGGLAFWAAILGVVVLALGCVIKGL
jgi:hypothetical protein